MKTADWDASKNERKVFVGGHFDALKKKSTVMDFNCLKFYMTFNHLKIEIHLKDNFDKSKLNERGYYFSVSERAPKTLNIPPVIN